MSWFFSNQIPLKKVIQIKDEQFVHSIFTNAIKTVQKERISFKFVIIQTKKNLQRIVNKGLTVEIFRLGLFELDFEMI